MTHTKDDMLMEILPCAICGTENPLMKLKIEPYKIWCRRCGYKVYGQSPHNAKNKWNTHTDTLPKQEAVDVEELYKKIKRDVTSEIEDRRIRAHHQNLGIDICLDYLLLKGYLTPK